LPECEKETDLDSWCAKNYCCAIESINPYPVIKHTFSHFRLAITPLVCRVHAAGYSLQDNTTQRWLTQSQWHQKGLAAPVKKLLQHLFEQTHSH
jgi:A/G-specific adenine glycosylase